MLHVHHVNTVMITRMWVALQQIINTASTSRCIVIKKGITPQMYFFNFSLTLFTSITVIYKKACYTSFDRNCLIIVGPIDWGGVYVYADELIRFFC